jgi:predicted GNAT family N-acyltransferase
MQAVEEAEELASVAHFVVESQTHAIPFYERLGYVAEGAVYEDAGIPHRSMRKPRYVQPNAARAAKAGV